MKDGYWEARADTVDEVCELVSLSQTADGLRKGLRGKFLALNRIYMSVLT